MDARGIPTAKCPECGDRVFTVEVIFDEKDYSIGMYMLDAECASCGTLVTAPTPLDLPEVSNE